MNKRFVSTVTAIAVTLLLATAFAAYAQLGKGKANGPGMHRMMGQGMRCGMMANNGNADLAAELRLTPAQKKDLQEIWQSFRAKTQDTRQQMQQNQTELRRLITAESPNSQVIKGKLHEISRLREKMMNIGVDRLLAARKVLTPQQRQIVQKKASDNGMMSMGLGMICAPESCARQMPARGGMHGGMRQGSGMGCGMGH